MEMKEEWLMPGAVVPVDAETTAALVAEIKRLIGVVGDMALNMQPAQQQKEGFASPGGGYVPAIPRQIPLDWKLVPRKATPEMLRAMDECAQEGYDERLYEGMASSVYMAAWDASPVMGSFPTSNTFKEWFYSKPHRAKYSSNHPAYLAAQEAWEAAHEACAKVCDEKVDAEYATGKVDHNEMGWTQACAAAIRARGQA